MCTSSLTYAAAINALAAIAALIAAGLWWRSANVSVPAATDPTLDAEGWGDAVIQVGPTDFIATIQLQGLWNQRAALAATVAALLQALAAVAAAYGW